MWHWAYWTCAAIAVLVAGGVFYFYGFSLTTLALALLVLVCPVLVVWATLWMAGRGEEEVDEMVRKRAQGGDEKSMTNNDGSYRDGRGTGR